MANDTRTPPLNNYFPGDSLADLCEKELGEKFRGDGRLPNQTFPSNHYVDEDYEPTGWKKAATDIIEIHREMRNILEDPSPRQLIDLERYMEGFDAETREEPPNSLPKGARRMVKRLSQNICNQISGYLEGGRATRGPWEDDKYPSTHILADVHGKAAGLAVAHNRIEDQFGEIPRSRINPSWKDTLYGSIRNSIGRDEDGEKAAEQAVNIYETIRDD